MKIPRIANSVGYIDDDLINAAAEYKKEKKNYWMKWGFLAACFAVLVIAITTNLPSLLGGNTSGGTNDRYKDFTIQESASDIIWPWEFQTVYEKYTELKIDNVQYNSKGREVSASYVGDSIGNYTVAGYDEISNGKKYTEEFEVYSLKDVSQSQFVAVKMDGKYYVFKKDEYAPPSDLGELLELVDLSKVTKIDHFSEGGDGPADKHYVLNDDNYIWTILADCYEAPFVEDDTWMVHDREYLSFTINSEVLGVYKGAMYITEDGYLWTNAFGYQYLFSIGEDATSKIIKYVRETSIKAEYESYRNSVVGTVTEITSEYILVDDSILCKNPEKGIAYKVLLSDLHISRYVDCGIVKEGDTVQVTYESELGMDNTIENAITISKATISGGDVLIPE